MKKHFFIFITILFISVPFAAAVGSPLDSVYSPFGIGTKYNPLYMQIEPDLLDSIKKNLESSAQEYERLKQVMRRIPQKVSGCEAKYNSIESYKDRILSMNTADPKTAASAQSYLEFLFDSYDMCIKYTQQWDQSCKDNVGPYGKLGIIDTVKKTYYCECQDGYEPDLKTNRCVPTPPPKTNDQLCKENYGTNSLWSGQTNAQGSLICGCVADYNWNNARTTCVKNEIKPVQSPPAPTQTPEVISPPKKQIAPIIEKQEPEIAADEALTASVIEISPPQIEKKRGFFQWLLGLFGLKK